MSDPILPKNYLFVDENGNHVELTMTYQELKDRTFKEEDQRGDFIMHRDEKLKRVFCSFGAPASSIWPKKSMSMGVGVHQIEEATKADRDHGVNVEYCPKTGDAIHTSMEHRRKHMKLLGLVDRDSYI